MVGRALRLRGSTGFLSGSILRVVLEGDRYVRDQLAPRLAHGETLEHTGYLTTLTGDSAVSGCSARAYLVGMTDQRLLMIETRVGGARPLLENHGVESIALTDIDSVAINGGFLSIALKSGSRHAYTHKKDARYFAGQAALRQALLVRFARRGSAAEALSKRGNRRWLLAVGFVLAVAGGSMVYEWTGRSKVSVRCQELITGILCELSQDGGRSSVESCWNLIVECSNGKPRKVKQCATVEPDSGSKVVIATSAIPKFDQCGEITDIKVRFVDE